MARFDYFVVFAEMRTGSNFLETNINMFDDLRCHGEAFNGLFVGYPDVDNILGVDQATRDRDPWTLIDAIKSDEGLAGFRFFNDHDPRVLDIVLGDPRCAKIVLTRNPLDSYISLKIANATGQWKLTNMNHAKSEKVTFDRDEFTQHMADLQGFQVKIMNVLQRTGQTAFYVAYEDLQDVNVMNGMAQFLGASDQITHLNRKLKKQNPAPMATKVANYAQMEKTLAGLDRFNLNRTPSYEPRRGPMIPSYIAAPDTGLLFQPLKSGPTEAVCRWMAQLDNKTPAALRTGFNQKSLRDWMARHEGHRSFTVIRHPVAWAHAAFCDRVVGSTDDNSDEMRAKLRKIYEIDVPDNQPVPETDSSYDLNAHRAAFLAWLGFLRGNLSGQTNLRVDPAWGSQLVALQGYSEYGPPDMIVRETKLRGDLAFLAGQLGREVMPSVPAMTDPYHDRLAAIYGPKIETAARQSYHRDYLAFGFGNWA